MILSARLVECFKPKEMGWLLIKSDATEGGGMGVIKMNHCTYLIAGTFEKLLGNHLPVQAIIHGLVVVAALIGDFLQPFESFLRKVNQ